jgi:hypothetical protein
MKRPPVSTSVVLKVKAGMVAEGFDRYGCLAAHFVDGGYYDNDGIASLIEFLSAALLYQPTENRAPANTAGPTLKEIRPHIHILLVEVRDSYDLDSSKSPESECTAEEDCKPWGTSDQAGTPLATFWRTGHGSISRRDRRELNILKRALQPISLKEVVFAFRGNPALSWHLTPCELEEIRAQIDSSDFKSEVQRVISWANMGDLKDPQDSQHTPNSPAVSRL